ncbi:hypothetical protein MNBD_GAMMA11-1901 [hydrothermal vent metagenome]|uniref:DUF4412 domain-containing protein n=1 Tax=hydrothermal vent metagenome TaxID=652676 RepID=A0A3B0XRY4_9ZZZZ
MKKIIKVLFVLLSISEISAAEIKNLALYYDEVEEGVEAQHMRYLINEQFLRIDDGSEQADFVLFDIGKKIIYSVNHDDQTVLKIDYKKWTKPAFKFSESSDTQAVPDAPKVHNQPVYNYQVKADGKVCTQVFLIKNTWPQQMKVLHLYQQVLSGQQVVTLKNTPVEFHTPCFLVDQVYHGGDYYQLGLPIQITYSRGYVKLLRDFKEIKLDKRLFELPAGYEVYKAFSAH